MFDSGVIHLMVFACTHIPYTISLLECQIILSGTGIHEKWFQAWTILNVFTDKIYSVYQCTIAFD